MRDKWPMLAKSMLKSEFTIETRRDRQAARDRSFQIESASSSLPFRCLLEKVYHMTYHEVFNPCKGHLGRQRLLIAPTREL